jgi:hypothetical protein
MKPSLLDLAAERRALEALLVESGGEIPPGSPVEAAWNANADALVTKIDHYAEFIGDLEAMAEKAREGAKRLQARAAALEAARERLLDRANMAIGPDRKEIRGDAWRLVRRQNPASVVILDEKALQASLPEAFSEVVTVKMDKKVVKEALKRCPEAVRGATLVQGERIEVVP